MTETSSLAKMVKSRVSLNDGLNGFPTIETDAVRLREVRPHEDAVHWHSLLASADAGPHQGKTVQDIEEMLEGVRGRFYNHQYVIYWAIALKSDDRMIGNVRFWEWAGHPERPLQFGTLQYGLVGPDASTAAARRRRCEPWGSSGSCGWVWRGCNVRSALATQSKRRPWRLPDSSRKERSVPGGSTRPASSGKMRQCSLSSPPTCRGEGTTCRTIILRGHSASRLASEA